MQANIQGKVSMHVGSKWSAKHNLRNYDVEKWNKDGHINQERTPLNVVLTNVPLEDFFEKTFGQAIKDYNEKNQKKHPDRVTSVKKYLNQQKSKVHEVIFQLSDHENYLKLIEQVGQDKADEIHKQYLTEVYNDWLERNPSLKVFSATIHMDEEKDGSPHLHMDFLPVAESSRGMSVKVSKDGAMKQLGFIREKNQKRADTPYIQWLISQRSRVEDIARNYIDVIPSEPSVLGHQQPQQYKAQVQKANAIEKIVEKFKGKPNLENAKTLLNNIDAIKQVNENETKLAKAEQQKAREMTKRAKAEQCKAKEEQCKAKEEQCKAKEEQLKAEEMQRKVLHNNKVVERKIAKLEIAIEQEVQRRLSPNTFWERQRQEDERYRRKQFEKQEELQEEFEKIKHKSIQRGR